MRLPSQAREWSAVAEENHDWTLTETGQDRGPSGVGRNHNVISGFQNQVRAQDPLAQLQ